MRGFIEHQHVKAGSGFQKNRTEARYILWWYTVSYKFGDDSLGNEKGMRVTAAIH